MRASVITALHAVPGDLGLGVFTPDQDSHVQCLTQATHIEPLQTTQQCPSFSHLPEAVLFCTFPLVSQENGSPALCPIQSTFSQPLGR